MTGPSDGEPAQPGTPPSFRDLYLLLGQGSPSAPTPPRQVAEQQLIRLQRRFTRSTGINDVYDTLRQHKIVFLDGAPGSGRTSAARVLLRELPRGAGIYHEVAPVAEGRSPEILSPDLVGEGDRMLLDLSAAGESLWKQYNARLAGFHKILEDKRAYLAVVLPHSYADHLSADYAEFRKKLHRPDGLEVILSHVYAHGVRALCPRPTPPDVRPIPQPLKDYLATHPPMRELARLTDVILEARSTLGMDSSFTDWCHVAIAAQTARAEEVDSFVPGLRKGSQRALLLTIAMLHGAPADAVHRATSLLQQLLGIPQDGRPLLEHKGLTERLRKVGAARDKSACVHFDKLRYDHAVRRHFWLNMPDLREPLRQWVDQVLDLPQLPDLDHVRLIRRFAELCLVTDGAIGLLNTASSWVQRPDSRPTYFRAAAELLSWGLANEETSLAFREHIYHQSQRSLATGPRQVLVAVCAQVMSLRYPEQAVVRLHHLARREPPDEHTARDVLLRYVAQDPRLQRYLLYRLFVFSPKRLNHREFDARLFLDLVTEPTRPPHSFLLSPVTRDWLTACWASVFRYTESTIWQPCLSQWVRAADVVDDPAVVHHALNVLVDAAANSYPALRQVYATARTCLSAEQSGVLLSRIHEVQRADLSQRIKSQEAPQP